MQFKLSSSALNSRLAAASKVLASKNSMPILECFLLELGEGTLTITASDSEKYYITTMPVLEQEGTGRFCVSARKLMDSLRDVPEQPMTITINDETGEMRGQHSTGHFSIMSKDAEPYPTARPVEDGTEVHFSANVILDAINRCIFATANDEVRLVMNGIFFEMHNDYAIFAATDGRKLVKNTIRSEQPGVEGSFILPKKVAVILKNVISKDEESITIRYTRDRATIITSEMTMHFRLIEGNYPNYNAVIPTSNPYHAIIDRHALASALKRVSVFCSQSSGLVKIELSNNSMCLSGQDNEYVTSAEEYLNCEYSNNNISIGFSCQYLIEICNIMEDDSIILELADPSRPGIVRPANEENGDELLMLLMPMRVED